ncbi:MAG: diguanylate cyclase [Campylobacterota bacterium]
MFISIKYKIFFAQFILILLLVCGLSYRFYSVQIDTHTKTLVNFYKNSTSWIENKLSLAISGGNYANVQLDSFVKSLAKHEKLLFFKAYGKTDYSKDYYEITYDKNLKKVYRSYHEDNYLQNIEEKISLLEKRLKNNISDTVKIDFLIDRLHDKRDQYLYSKDLIKKVDKRYLKLLEHERIFFDYENGLLLLPLNTSNTNSGVVKFVFDISNIQNIKNETIKNVALESFFVLLLSIAVLWIVSYKIIKPLDDLTKTISKDFHCIDTNKVPHTNTKDEIGVLAKSFQVLLLEMNNYIQRLEHLSKNDPLTGLYNRRAFDEIFAKTFKKTKAKYIALLYIDIDNFKPYNDHYGHNLGDVTLQSVSKSINDSLHRKTDYAFRLGGEEFAVLLNTNTQDEAKLIAQRVRKNIQDLKIEHIYNKPSNLVTISIGVYVTANKQDIKLTELLNKADEALYQSKKNGRNRVTIKTI